MITDFGGWKMDVTAMTMLLVCKLTCMACNFHDGMMPDEKLFKEHQIRRSFKRPTLLEVMSYTFFIGGCVCGPFLEYKDFIDFIEKNGHYKDLPKNTIVPSLTRISHNLLCVAINVIGCAYFPWSFCI